jgi:hypothetical protein
MGISLPKDIFTFNKDYLTQIYCMTKTFIATLVGILIKEGKIKSVNQKVLEFPWNYFIQKGVSLDV